MLRLVGQVCCGFSSSTWFSRTNCSDCTSRFRHAQNTKRPEFHLTRLQITRVDRSAKIASVPAHNVQKFVFTEYFAQLLVSLHEGIAFLMRSRDDPLHAKYCRDVVQG